VRRERDDSEIFGNSAREIRWGIRIGLGNAFAQSSGETVRPTDRPMSRRSILAICDNNDASSTAVRVTVRKRQRHPTRH